MLGRCLEVFRRMDEPWVEVHRCGGAGGWGKWLGCRSGNGVGVLRLYGEFSVGFCWGCVEFYVYIYILMGRKCRGAVGGWVARMKAMNNALELYYIQ